MNTAVFRCYFPDRIFRLSGGTRSTVIWFALKTPENTNLRKRPENRDRRKNTRQNETLDVRDLARCLPTTPFFASGSQKSRIFRPDQVRFFENPHGSSGKTVLIHGFSRKFAGFWTWDPAQNSGGYPLNWHVREVRNMGDLGNFGTLFA